MAPLFGLVFDALAISAVYALVAVGFTLIYGVGNVLNFAHGAFLTVGAFVAYLVSNADTPGLNPWFGLAVATVVVGALGAITYVVLVRHLRNRPAIALVGTILGGFFLHHALRVAVSASTVTVPKPVEGEADLVVQVVPLHELVTILTALVLVGALIVALDRTAQGRAIRATIMSAKGATLSGVNHDRVNLLIWVIAAALAGFAGVLLAGRGGASWSMGVVPLAVSVAAAVVGGLGSVRGAIYAAVGIGVLETAATQVFDVTGLAALVVLVAVLVLRPTGLFGREVPA